MAGEKKMSERLAPLLKRYEGDAALFGTRVKKALEIIKAARNGAKVKPDEPGASR